MRNVFDALLDFRPPLWLAATLALSGIAMMLLGAYVVVAYGILPGVLIASAGSVLAVLAMEWVRWA